jgi:putative oxidoreductase
LALVAGLFSRVSAFGIGAVITVAALMAHLPNGSFMNWNGNQNGEGFEYHILMAAIAIAVVFQGGGKWAPDTVIHRELAGRDEKKPAINGAAVVAAR